MAASALTKQTVKNLLTEETLLERTFVDCNPDGNTLELDDKSFFEIKNIGAIPLSVVFTTVADNWGKTFTLTKAVAAGKTLLSGLLTKYLRTTVTFTYPLGVSVPGDNPDAWLIGTTYVKDQLCYHSGVAYKAIETDEDPANIGIEPGVTVGWEDFWEVYEVPAVPILKINVFGY